MRRVGLVSIAMMVATSLGCGEDTSGETGGTGGDGAGGAGATGGSTGFVVPQTYAFERAGESTVSYTGQITRQVLISDLIGVMQMISADVLGGQNLERYDTAQEVYDLVVPLFDLGGAADPARTLPGLFAGEDEALQATYSDLNDKNLVEKLAGNDSSTDHVVWTDPGVFVGWAEANLATNAVGDLGAPGTPEELLRGLLWTFAGQAAAGANGSFAIDAATPLYLTSEGHDLTQLVQKFLLGAVNFSQGTDDYLDDDVTDKGLLKANIIEGEDPFTGLEHHWDEAFGYWGAARDYSLYTDDEIAGSGGRGEYEFGYFDSNGDGLIDLTSECNFSASVNAAKRDRGSVAPTDFTADADLAWRTGRTIIAAAYDAGEEVDMAALAAQRDTIVMTWEKALAATAIHYINDVVADMDAIGTQDYSFADHAKHWSELKGFVLSFQFNPRSPMTDSDFATIHSEIGDAPVGASPDTPSDDSDYRAALLSTRARIGDTYGFDEDNILAW